MKSISNLQVVLCIGKNHKCEIIDDTYFLYIRYLSCNGTDFNYSYLVLFREKIEKYIKLILTSCCTRVRI
jgi:hypothetical protein